MKVCSLEELLWYPPIHPSDTIRPLRCSYHGSRGHELGDQETGSLPQPRSRRAGEYTMTHRHIHSSWVKASTHVGTASTQEDGGNGRRQPGHLPGGRAQ